LPEDPRIPGRRFGGLQIAAALLALAVLVRLPSFVLPSLDWDEGLYLTIAADLNAGHLPYAGLWDRKPVGIFVLFALVERAFADGVLGVRILACLFVALGSFALYRIALALFVPGATIGIAAAVAYILFSGENSGLAANTEAFFVPLTLVGFALALGAGPATGDRRLDLAAGVVLGVAFQIKFVVLFDLAALAAAVVILGGGAGRSWRERVATTLPRLGAMMLGFGLPSLAVVIWYAAAGELQALLRANLVANLARFERPFGRLVVPLYAAINYGPLCIAAGLALLFGRSLAAGEAERRGLLVVAVWIAAVVLGLLLLRRWYEHYFIQLLPPLCLLTGFIATRVVLDVMRRPSGYACAVVLLVAGAFFAANKNAFLAAGDLILQRQADPAAGDTARLAARAITAELRTGDSVFVFDHDPVIYYLTAAAAPTRYPFPGHWFDGAEGVFDPLTELEQVLALEPRFIITRCDTFGSSEGRGAGPATIDDGEPRYRLVKDRLHAALMASYELVASYPPADVWGGQIVGIKPWGADIWRRRAE
jgi:Dolichyl-phosphate-mannose-protein mannosyltransferase